jgi:hypothetical protein
LQPISNCGRRRHSCEPGRLHAVTADEVRA